MALAVNKVPVDVMETNAKSVLRLAFTKRLVATETMCTDSGEMGAACIARCMTNTNRCNGTMREVLTNSADTKWFNAP